MHHLSHLDVLCLWLCMIPFTLAALGAALDISRNLED